MVLDMALLLNKQELKADRTEEEGSNGEGD
jgi:hypothetical protein